MHFHGYPFHWLSKCIVAISNAAKECTILFQWTWWFEIRCEFSHFLFHPITREWLETWTWTWTRVNDPNGLLLDDIYSLYMSVPKTFLCPIKCYQLSKRNSNLDSACFYTKESNWKETFIRPKYFWGTWYMWRWFPVSSRLSEVHFLYFFHKWLW